MYYMQSKMLKFSLTVCAVLEKRPSERQILPVHPFWPVPGGTIDSGLVDMVHARVTTLADFTGQTGEGS